jgi:hypothetical protein
VGCCSRPAGRTERGDLPGPPPASAHARVSPGRPSVCCGALVRIAFHESHRVDTWDSFSRLNRWPMHSPADASPIPSRAPAYSLGPMWIATPSSQGTAPSTPRRSPGASAYRFQRVARRGRSAPPLVPSRPCDASARPWIEAFYFLLSQWPQGKRGGSRGATRAGRDGQAIHQDERHGDESGFFDLQRLGVTEGQMQTLVVTA